MSLHLPENALRVRPSGCPAVSHQRQRLSPRVEEWGLRFLFVESPLILYCMLIHQS